MSRRSRSEEETRRPARRTTALATVLASAFSLPLVLASPSSADAVPSGLTTVAPVSAADSEECQKTDTCTTTTQPSAAEAKALDANGCTWAPYGTVCGEVYGTDKFINDARVTRNTYSLEGICDYRGRFEVFNAKGKLLHGRNSAVQRGCVPLTAYIHFDKIKRNFGTGAKACLSWWQKGVIQGSRTCFKLSNG